MTHRLAERSRGTCVCLTPAVVARRDQLRSRLRLSVLCLGLLVLVVTGGCRAKRSQVVASTGEQKRKIHSPKLVLDATIVQGDGDGRIRFEGRVCVTREIRSWTEITDHYEGSRGYFRKTKEQGGNSEVQRFVPGSVALAVNKGEAVSVTVDPSGTFRTQGFWKGPARPGDSRYHFVEEERGVFIELHAAAVVQIDGEPKLVEGRERYTVRGWRLRPNYEAVDGFLSGLSKDVFTVTVSFKDSNTRIAVSPRATVTAIDVPDVRMKAMARIGREFNGQPLRDELVKYAAERLPAYMQKGEHADAEGQTMSFSAVQNGRYRLQTVEPRYYHQDVTIVADARRARKTVLLIETGTKLRVEQSKEGEGSVIDE